MTLKKWALTSLALLTAGGMTPAFSATKDCLNKVDDTKQAEVLPASKTYKHFYKLDKSTKSFQQLVYIRCRFEGKAATPTTFETEVNKVIKDELGSTPQLTAGNQWQKEELEKLDAQINRQPAPRLPENNTPDEIAKAEKLTKSRQARYAVAKSASDLLIDSDLNELGKRGTKKENHVYDGKTFVFNNTYYFNHDVENLIFTIVATGVPGQINEFKSFNSDANFSIVKVESEVPGKRVYEVLVKLFVDVQFKASYAGDLEGSSDTVLKNFIDKLNSKLIYGENGKEPFFKRLEKAL